MIAKALAAASATPLHVSVYLPKLYRALEFTHLQHGSGVLLSTEESAERRQSAVLSVQGRKTHVTNRLQKKLLAQKSWLRFTQPKTFGNFLQGNKNFTVYSPIEIGAHGPFPHPSSHKIVHSDGGSHT